jgi:hypothetical protein
MTMPDYQLAETVLSREVARLENLAGLKDLRDIFVNIGSLQNATTEAQARFEAARAAEVEAQADLEKIHQQVADAKAAAASEIADAQAAADAVLTRAKVAAAAIVAGAEAKASQIISDAEARTSETNRRAAVLADALKAAGAA